MKAERKREEWRVSSDVLVKLSEKGQDEDPHCRISTLNGLQRQTASYRLTDHQRYRSGLQVAILASDTHITIIRLQNALDTR